MTTMTERWALVAERLETAKAMHHDGCHRIYLSMDDEQVETMRMYGYDAVEPNLAVLQEWYENSCSLRLVNAVRTNEDGDDFEQLVPQFAEDEGTSSISDETIAEVAAVSAANHEADADEDWDVYEYGFTWADRRGEGYEHTFPGRPTMDEMRAYVAERSRLIAPAVLLRRPRVSWTEIE